MVKRRKLKPKSGIPVSCVSNALKCVQLRFLQNLNRVVSEKKGGLRGPDIVYYETKKQAHFDNVALPRATICVMSGIESAGSRGL
jgi:hypothetical protein